MTTSTATSTSATSGDSATARAADLEAAAAEAAATAAQAREAADARMRVEVAARGRAEDQWTADQLAARRPHAAAERIDQAWSALLDEITTGTPDLIGAWARFCTIRGENVAVVRAFEGPGGPSVSHRWDPQRPHDNPTLLDAIVAAAHRAGTQAMSDAYGRVEEQIEDERQAHNDAAVAALPADAEARPVAMFHLPSGQPGWDNLTNHGAVEYAGVEVHPSGVARAFSLLAARQLRAVVANSGPRGLREIDETEAARLSLAHENGVDETESSIEADAARAADHAARVGALPYKAGAVTGRKRGGITERSDARPAVEDDRA